MARWGLRELYVLSFLMGLYFVNRPRAIEYLDLIQKQPRSRSRPATTASVFYLTTGFHGPSTWTGGPARPFMFLLEQRRTLAAKKFTHEQQVSAIVVSYYWHFVDVVWIGLFHDHLPDPLTREAGEICEAGSPQGRRHPCGGFTPSSCLASCWSGRPLYATVTGGTSALGSAAGGDGGRRRRSPPASTYTRKDPVPPATADFRAGHHQRAAADRRRPPPACRLPGEHRPHARGPALGARAGPQAPGAETRSRPASIRRLTSPRWAAARRSRSDCPGQRRGGRRNVGLGQQLFHGQLLASATTSSAPAARSPTASFAPAAERRQRPRQVYEADAGPGPRAIAGLQRHHGHAQPRKRDIIALRDPGPAHPGQPRRLSASAWVGPGHRGAGRLSSAILVFMVLTALVDYRQEVQSTGKSHDRQQRPHGTAPPSRASPRQGD